MRVPHTIPMSTFKAYAASEQTVSLVAERLRQLRAEDLTWDEGEPTSLAYICIKVLCANFEIHSDVLPFLILPDLDYLLEVLPVDLPIFVVAPIIEDGIYWKRCCESRWKNEPLDVRRYGNSWRRMYIERHVEEYIHYQEPGYIDWDDVSHLMEVCSPFVIQLNIRELKPPRDLLPEAKPPDECIRGLIDPVHMDLSPVLQKLVNLEKLSLRFGLRGCGMDFEPIFFKISTEDIINLSKGLEISQNLRVFRLHRCNIDDAKVNIILSALLKCQFLYELELSHCIFGDIAAKSLGKFMLEHKNLTRLLIQNNKITEEGVMGIAYAMKNEECCPIKCLDLQFNLIGDKGAQHLSVALTKNLTIEEINLGGAGITSVGANKLAGSALFSSSLRCLILCNNHLDSNATESIIHAVHSNRRIETFDIRNCGVGSETETTVHKYIARNRLFHRNV